MLLYEKVSRVIYKGIYENLIKKRDVKYHMKVYDNL